MAWDLDTQGRGVINEIQCGSLWEPKIREKGGCPIEGSRASKGGGGKEPRTVGRVAGSSTSQRRLAGVFRDHSEEGYEGCVLGPGRKFAAHMQTERSRRRG